MKKQDVSKMKNPAERVRTAPVFNEDPAADEQQSEKKGKGRPRKEGIIREPGAQQGLTKDFTRTTFIMDVATLDKLKDFAYTKHATTKEALQFILTDFFRRYEADPDNETLLDHKKTLLEVKEDE